MLLAGGGNWLPYMTLPIAKTINTLLYATFGGQLYVTDPLIQQHSTHKSLP